MEDPLSATPPPPALAREAVRSLEGITIKPLIGRWFIRFAYEGRLDLSVQVLPL